MDIMQNKNHSQKDSSADPHTHLEVRKVWAKPTELLFTWKPHKEQHTLKRQSLEEMVKVSSEPQGHATRCHDTHIPTCWSNFPLVSLPPGLELNLFPRNNTWPFFLRISHLTSFQTANGSYPIVKRNLYKAHYLICCSEFNFALLKCTPNCPLGGYACR